MSIHSTRLIVAGLAASLACFVLVLLPGGSPVVSAQRGIGTPTPAPTPRPTSTLDPSMPPTAVPPGQAQLPLITPAPVRTAVAAIPIAGAPGETVLASVAVVPADLEIIFGPSRSTLSVGESWSVNAEITNRSKVPIWIVDTKTVLVVAPEVFGNMKRRYGIYAILPTERYEDDGETVENLWQNDRFVRIEAGSKYPVLWRNDGLDLSESLFSHAYFSPGSYRATVLLQYWLVQPEIENVEDPGRPNVRYNRVRDSDKTATATATRDIPYDASIWVLLFGAAAGGLLSWFVQVVTGRNRPITSQSGSNRYLRAITFTFELFAAVLLPIVVTILIARLSSTESPIGLRVRDIWGAIAMGFVVQWLGIAWFNRIMPGGGDQHSKSTGTDQEQPPTETQGEEAARPANRVAALPAEAGAPVATDAEPPTPAPALALTGPSSEGPPAPRSSVNGM